MAHVAESDMLWLETSQRSAFASKSAFEALPFSIIAFLRLNNATEKLSVSKERDSKFPIQSMVCPACQDLVEDIVDDAM